MNMKEYSRFIQLIIVFKLLGLAAGTLELSSFFHTDSGNQRTVSNYLEDLKDSTANQDLQA